MRTHRLVFDCSSSDFADYLENEVLKVDFCDLTHWYCGLDGEGEDTPDLCVIYRGALFNNRIYVELDLQRSSFTVDELHRLYDRFNGPYFKNRSPLNRFKEKYPNCHSWYMNEFKIDTIQ